MKKKNGFLKKAYRFILKLIIGFFVLSIFSVIIFRWVPIPVTPLMLIRLAEQASEGKDLKLNKEWVPMEKISHHLPIAVVASEDQRFLKHYGFEFDAMKRAMEHNKKGKRIRGGSTISQQTAKNVFLWHGRNYLRKGLEVYFTALIEFFWSKERIMEVYLNVIEMGDGIYGAQAASKKYFNTDAQKLTPHQAATIAAILPNPRKYSASKPGPYIQRRQTGIQVQMRNLGGKLDFDKKQEEEKKPEKKKKKAASNKI
ncbi:MAG: monofunctional biosynthetic peptidoglycan transglycosylase [Bacteroidetes bacterium]|nr:monofunctional biosynthetic peptidoglycan transglycosylase [Bacteroidota bacterium]